MNLETKDGGKSGVLAIFQRVYMETSVVTKRFYSGVVPIFISLFTAYTVKQLARLYNIANVALFKSNNTNFKR